MKGIIAAGLFPQVRKCLQQNKESSKTFLKDENGNKIFLSGLSVNHGKVLNGEFMAYYLIRGVMRNERLQQNSSSKLSIFDTTNVNQTLVYLFTPYGELQPDQIKEYLNFE